MLKIKNWVSKLTKTQKITYTIMFICLVLVLTIAIPTLSEFTDNPEAPALNVWDGSVAGSYKSGNGTKSNPYVISNGKELAFFSEKLKTTDYADNYFILSDDIILNEGTFSYDIDAGIKYTLNGSTYYITPYTDDYYTNESRTGDAYGTVNILKSLSNFKGTLNGNSKTIYGSYITDINANELGLFTNLQGTVSDLKLTNTLVYGGYITGGLASKTNGATINNVLVDGYVIGTNVEENKTATFTPADISLTLSANPVPYYIDILDSLPFIGGKITGSTLAGSFAPLTGPANKMTITVNGLPIKTGNSAAPFGPDNVGTNIENVPVVGSIQNNSGTANLTSLKYVIIWDYAATGGLIGHASDTLIENSINKTTVIGKLTSGGIIGTSTASLTVNSSYNTGEVRATFASGGIVGLIEKSTEVNISNTYNTGSYSLGNTLSGGLIGHFFNNNEVNIKNSFNAFNSFTFGVIKSTIVNVENLKYIYSPLVKEGEVNGSADKTTNSGLLNKQTLISMGFNEFISEEYLKSDPSSKWIYIDGDYPIAYMDNKLDPLINIHVNNNVYSTLNNIVGVKNIKSSISFVVEDYSALNTPSEKYYYVSSSINVLTKSELDSITSWRELEDINQITEEGKHIIYVKTKDKHGDVKYVNTDILVLDNTGPSLNINLETSVWSDLKTDLTNINLDIVKPLTVEATDSLSSVKDISYHVSRDILSINDLDNLASEDWEEYEDSISLYNGKNIYYIRVTDNSGNITYANTDFITVNGYECTSIYFGRNKNSYTNTGYVSSNSIITYVFDYSASGANELLNHTHNLVSNTLLPSDTEIVIYDYKIGKAYKYTTEEENSYGYNSNDEESYATYPFTLFNELGNINEYKYIENTYFIDGNVEEKFMIVINLKNTNTTKNYYGVKLSLELRNPSNELARSTVGLNEEINIISSSSSKININTDYNNQMITLNRDSYTEIDISSKISYKNFEDSIVIDTNYEDKKLGLQIRFVNSSGDILPKKHLENILIKLGNNAYSLDDYSSINYQYNSETEGNIIMKIETREHETSLSPGTYFLKIATTLSYDGSYQGADTSNEITIPITVLEGNKSSKNYNFDIDMESSKQIISKSLGNVDIDFNFIIDEELENPSIRMSLYSKDELTAYNQNYSIINLSDFSTNNLKEYSTNIYTVELNKNKFTLSLNLKELDYNGYKLVFDLYDGDTRIESLKKHFIVK